MASTPSGGDAAASPRAAAGRLHAILRGRRADLGRHLVRRGPTHSLTSLRLYPCDYVLVARKPSAAGAA